MEEKEGGESSTIEAHPSGAEHLGVPACLQKKVNPCQVPAVPGRQVHYHIFCGEGEAAVLLC